MRKLGFLFAMGVVLVTLASSTCKPRDTKTVLAAPIGTTSGSGTGSSGSLKPGSLKMYIVQQTTAGSAAPFATGNVYWTQDSAFNGKIVPGTSERTGDAMGFILFTGLPPRTYSVTAKYFTGTDTLRGQTDGLSVTAGGLRSAQVIVN